MTQYYERRRKLSMRHQIPSSDTKNDHQQSSRKAPKRRRRRQLVGTELHDVDIAEESIIGGSPVMGDSSFFNPYPYYGHSAGIKLCGATLIYKDLLLTAAHCTAAFIDTGVYVDSVRRHSGRWFPVLQEFQHPLYANSMFDETNDIMLVLIDTTYNNTSNTPDTSNVVGGVTATVTMSSKVKELEYVELNVDSTRPIDGTKMTVIGFGDSVENGVSSVNLLSVDVQATNVQKCRDYYGTNYFGNNFVVPGMMICNGAQNFSLGGQDSCQVS
jgi:hypothetical protein